MERLDVAVLLRGVYPDVFHLDSQVRNGLSEVLAGVLESIVALESQTRAVRLGHCDSLHYRLDGDIVGGHGVELVGQSFSGEYVHHVEAEHHPSTWPHQTYVMSVSQYWLGLVAWIGFQWALGSFVDSFNLPHPIFL